MRCATKLSFIYFLPLPSLFFHLTQLNVTEIKAKANDYKTPAPSTTNTALPPPGLETTTAASLCSALNSRLL